MIIFSDSRDPIFNSGDPNRVPRIRENYIIGSLKYLKKPALIFLTTICRKITSEGGY